MHVSPNNINIDFSVGFDNAAQLASSETPISARLVKLLQSVVDRSYRRRHSAYIIILS